MNVNCSEENGFLFLIEKIKIKVDLPKPDEDVADILVIGNLLIIPCPLILCFFLCCSSDKCEGVYRYMCKQHLVTSVQHLIALNALFQLYPDEAGSSTVILYHLTGYLSSLVPFWTACISLKMFADLYIVSAGSNGYSKSDVMKFARISILLISMYEEAMLTMFPLFASPCDLMESLLVPAIRMTCILIVTSIPVAVLCSFLYHCIRRSDNINLKLAVMFLMHLFTFVTSDIILIVFKVVCPKKSEDMEDDGIMEILKGTSLASRDEAARAAAVLRWTLQQAHRCSCSGVQLARDLLVLGVPRAHAAALADAADTTRDGYETKIASNGFMVNKLTDVSAAPGPEGTVDTVKLTLHTDDVFTAKQKKEDLIIDKSQMKILLAELKKAKEKVDEISVS
ncbi:COMM domain containing 4 [Danaus plexippus plexippus]|uniref:COMM domain containing 4 n=1 Tax=Danaus plexippus plexippus TaxID=278856 RepID=A0A212F7T9_DANPL|nr:COMM domain containing 4 [Danaus plexippus plexippus]